MSDEETAYFLKLIQTIMVMTEPKFELGAIEHRAEGLLWNMSDEQLNAAIEDELKDLMMYQGEKWRRQLEGRWSTIKIEKLPMNTLPFHLGAERQ